MLSTIDLRQCAIKESQMTTQHPPIGSDVDASRDGDLDAGALTDADYLAKFGYQQELNRSIGLFSSFAIQFSSIGIISVTYTTLVVGLGFFGPASFWSWVIGGFLQVFLIGLAMSELVSAYPLAGGVYQITSRILSQSKSKLVPSKWLSWQTGWWIVIAHTVAVAAVAYSMIPFIANWFGVEELSTTANLLGAIGLCALSTLINVIGVRAASLMNNLGVIAEIVAGIIVIGALLIVHHQWQSPAILNDTAGTVTDGDWVKPFLFSLLLPLFLIQSFDATGNAAEETHDAARKAPLGNFLANTSAWVVGVIFVGLIYLSIPNLADVMGSSTPVNVVLESTIGHFLTELFQSIAIVALLANLVVIQLTGARVLWSQARDGEMPAADFLRKVSALKVPINATLVIFAGTVLVLIVGSQSATALAVLVGMAALAWTLCYGVVVAVGLWALVTDRLPKRPFHCGRFSVLVFGLAVPWALLSCAILVWQNPLPVGGGMIGAIILGSILYALIPRKKNVADTEVTGAGSTLPA
jgi:amino acid transporter